MNLYFLATLFPSMKTSNILQWLLFAILSLLAIQATQEKQGKKEEEEDLNNDYEIYEAIQSMKKLTGHEDFYELLGVSSKATTEEIGKAFRKASINYHPDRKGKAMLPMFKLIQYASDLLRDQKRRARYEWLLHEAPAWHRGSVYSIRKFVQNSKVSLKQFWILLFFFSLGGQFLTQWLAYLVHVGRAMLARKHLGQLGEKEVKRIRKKLESGN